MVFDRSEHEPEEWDPEEEFTDSDSDSLTIPKVSTEDAGSDLGSDLRSEFGSSTEPEIETDVPSDLLQTFWSLVLVINAAVLALSLGVLFLVFEGPSTNGIVLFLGGIVLSGFAVRRYRTSRPSDGADPSTPDETSAESDRDADPSAPDETPAEPEHRSPADHDRT